MHDGRHLTRFDVDFDLPERFLAPFPPAMHLTPRPDLGDVSQGKLVSLTNATKKRVNPLERAIASSRVAQ